MMSIDDKIRILSNIFNEDNKFTFRTITDNYSRVEIKCPNCSGCFERLFKNIKRNQGCQLTCSLCGYYNSYERQESKKCSFCNELISGDKKWRKNKYCNLDCMGQDTTKKALDKYFKNPEQYTEITSTIRAYVLKINDCKCSKCNFQGVNEKTGETIVQVDHIDGNSENNHPDNLRTLCPNCHAMTPTFGALNLGNGRQNRRLHRAKFLAKLKSIELNE